MTVAFPADRQTKVAVAGEATRFPQPAPLGEQLVSAGLLAGQHLG